MSEFDVEMIETGTDETKDDTCDAKSKGTEVSGGSKSLESASKAYELPWLALIIYRPPVKCGSADLRIFKRVKCGWFCGFG